MVWDMKIVGRNTPKKKRKEHHSRKEPSKKTHNNKRGKADRAKKNQELGIRSKDDVWIENHEVVMRCLEEGVVLDNKHKRWLQRQKKADISDDKRERIKGLESHSKNRKKYKLISVKAGGLFYILKFWFRNSEI